MHGEGEDNKTKVLKFFFYITPSIKHYHDIIYMYCHYESAIQDVSK